MSNFTPEMTTLNGKPAVTSRQIAEDFEKLHKNVIRDIEAMEVSENFRKLNFELSEYSIENQSRKYKQYLLTRDGFTMVAMGFTGSKAIQFKEGYIQAFNTMEAALLNHVAQLPNPETLPEETISEKQKAELSNAIRSVTSYARYTGSAPQWVWNNLRHHFHLQTSGQLPAKDFDMAMQLVKSLEEPAKLFRSWLDEAEDEFTKEVMGGGKAWTPMLRTGLKRKLKERLPVNPDWKAISQKLEQIEA